MMCLVCELSHWDVLLAVLCVDQEIPNDLLHCVCVCTKRDNVNMSCVAICTFIADKPQCMPWLSTNDSNTLGQIKTSLQKDNTSPQLDLIYGWVFMEG